MIYVCIMQTQTQKTPKTASGMKIVNAQRPITFKVTDAAIKIAKCKDPEHCVIAEALRDHFGDLFEAVHVGSNVTKVFLSDRIIRFSTPGAIKKAIPIFDKTGLWPLEKNKTYRLCAFWEKSPPKKKSGKSGKSKTSGFQGKHRSIRSRPTSCIRASTAAA
jgi:hypothetical protein